MAKEELFRNPFGRKLFTALGGIPVDARLTERARSAMKAVQAALEAGEPAAVFPEGTRRARPRRRRLFDGTAYLAVKLGVPIVPVGIGGSEEILASGKKLPRLHRVVGVGRRADRAAARREHPAPRRLVAISDELMKSLQTSLRRARREAGCD